MDRAGTRAPVVCLLDVDPDFGRGIAPPEYEHARHAAMARLLTLEDRTWVPAELGGAGEAGWLGLVVIEGLLLRRVSAAHRAACELFGTGDVLRPWDRDSDYEPLAIDVDWQVLAPTRLAVLDGEFARRVARWPSIAAELLQRTSMRARQLSLTAAVSHLPRTHLRVLLIFWLLAERWGTVGPEGVLVRVPLTHQTLAMLAGSHRPTATIAVRTLARQRLLIRRGPDRWLITNEGLEALKGWPSP